MVVLIISTIISALAIFAIAYQSKQDAELHVYKFYSDDVVALITVRGDVHTAFELSRRLMMEWKRVDRINPNTGETIATFLDTTDGTLTEHGKRIVEIAE